MEEEIREVARLNGKKIELRADKINSNGSKGRVKGKVNVLLLHEKGGRSIMCEQCEMWLFIQENGIGEKEWEECIFECQRCISGKQATKELVSMKEELETNESEKGALRSRIKVVEESNIRIEKELEVRNRKLTDLTAKHTSIASDELSILGEHNYMAKLGTIVEKKDLVMEMEERERGYKIKLKEQEKEIKEMESKLEEQENEREQGKYSREENLKWLRERFDEKEEELKRSCVESDKEDKKRMKKIWRDVALSMIKEDEEEAWSRIHDDKWQKEDEREKQWRVDWNKVQKEGKKMKAKSSVGTSSSLGKIDLDDRREVCIKSVGQTPQLTKCITEDKVVKRHQQAEIEREENIKGQKNLDLMAIGDSNVGFTYRELGIGENEGRRMFMYRGAGVLQIKEKLKQEIKNVKDGGRVIIHAGGNGLNYVGTMKTVSSIRQMVEIVREQVKEPKIAIIPLFVRELEGMNYERMRKEVNWRIDQMARTLGVDILYMKDVRREPIAEDRVHLSWYGRKNIGYVVREWVSEGRDRNEEKEDEIKGKDMNMRKLLEKINKIENCLNTLMNEKGPVAN